MKLISHIKTIFWYGLYVIAVAGVLLVLRFPSNDLKEYVESAIAQVNSASVLSISSLKLRFPARIWFEQIELAHKVEKGTQNLLVAENVSVHAEPVSFLKGDYTFHFQGEVYEGNMNGMVRVNDKDSGTMTADLSLKDVQTEKYGLIPALTNFNLNSNLSGELSYDGNVSSLVDGTGGATFELEEGSIGLVKPLLGFDGLIGFKKMRFEASLQKQRLLIKADFKGIELQGALKGTIKLQKQISRSILTLEGSLNALDQLFSEESQISGVGLDLLKKKLERGPLSFMITGTVADPKVKLY